ncbi:hypothetical protein PARPLA_02939 [Rhodobacteraceae bacterium THAF1]|nr:hypothetical protein [Palleronia sp. THAF1]QFU08340.1 hypothetical protein FIU81_06605 [Palleronia sp. THAF1]VDC29001.1 hypothetical protein PARPLA_02939 [Rhodobacteraceae bacterium THAF1]
MLKSHLPERLKQFLHTEAGLFSIQCVLFVPIVGLGVTLILPAL